MNNLNMLVTYSYIQNELGLVDHMQVHSSGTMLGSVSYLKENPPSEVVVKRRDFIEPGTGAQHCLIPSTWQKRGQQSRVE